MILGALIAPCVIFTILLQSNTLIKAFVGSTFLTALVYVALRLSYSAAKEENKLTGRTFDKSTADTAIKSARWFVLGNASMRLLPTAPRRTHRIRL